MQTTETAGVKLSPPLPPESLRTREEVAMRKIEALRNATGGIFTHDFPYPILQDILGEGLLSEDLKKKLGKPSKSFYSGPEILWLKGLNLFHAPNGATVKEGEFTTIGVIIKGPLRIGAKGFPVVDDRTDPQKFMGILLSDERIDFISTEGQLTESRRGQDATDFATQVASRIAEEYFTPDNSLPVLGTSGDLLWPRYIPSEELGIKPQYIKI